MGHLRHKAGRDDDRAHRRDCVQTCSAGSDLYCLSKQVWQNWRKKGRIRTWARFKCTSKDGFILWPTGATIQPNQWGQEEKATNPTLRRRGVNLLSPNTGFGEKFMLLRWGEHFGWMITWIYRATGTPFLHRDRQMWALTKTRRIQTSINYALLRIPILNSRRQQQIKNLKKILKKDVRPMAWLSPSSATATRDLSKEAWGWGTGGGQRAQQMV